MRILIVAYLVEVVVLLCRHKQYIFICNFFFSINKTVWCIRWMSLGNQLNGVRLVDDGLRARFKAAYPEQVVQPVSPPRPSAMEVEPNAPQSRSPFADVRTSEAASVTEEKPMNVGMEMGS